MTPKQPDIPTIQPPQVQPLDTSAADLAAKRRALDQRRRGLQSLTIQPDAGTSVPASGGLSIPNG